MWFKRIISSTIAVTLLMATVQAYSAYGKQICRMAGYTCITVASGQSWHSLFPNDEDRIIVKKVNRMNTRLHPGMTIAVPQNLQSISLFDVSPFPDRIPARDTKLIKVDLSQLAWGAYDQAGYLLNWGPVSGGKNYCPDVKRGCQTVKGSYTVYSLSGPHHVSSRFPLPNGGAPMPFAMHFHKGYALHASETVPGYHASHGCVRLFYEDAEWLNRQFVDVGSTRIVISH